MRIEVLLFASLFTLGSLSLSSCKTEGCTDPESDNYDPDAEEDDGTCVPWRDKFVGTYNAAEVCAGQIDETGVLTVTPSGAKENALVFTFTSDTQSYTFSGEVDDSRTLTIPVQTITLNGLPTGMTGQGSLANNNTSLDLDYNFTSGALTVICGLNGEKL